jgi:hypothetical protein
VKLKVALEFPATEADVIRQFCGEIGMNVTEFCKRAVYYSINDSYKRAQSAVQEHVSESHNTESGIVEPDLAEGIRVLADASPSTLPHTEVAQDLGTT